MKKHLLVYLAAMLFIVGCSQKNNNEDNDYQEENQTSISDTNQTKSKDQHTSPPDNSKIDSENTSEQKDASYSKTESKDEKNDGLSKDEIISKFTSEDEYDSYRLNVEGQTLQMLENGDQVELDSYVSEVIYTKDPTAFHTFYDITRDQTEINIEYYSDGDTWIYRQDEGPWMQVPPSDGEKEVYKTNSDWYKTLIALKDYIDISETDSSFIVEINSTDENIDLIRKELLDLEEGEISFGEVSSVKKKYEFSKDNVYLIYFESETEFTSDSQGVVRFFEKGGYKDINQIDKIEIPEEVQAMF